MATVPGRVALALEEAGATMLACADIEEGVALRRAGVTRADPGLRGAQRERPRRDPGARPHAHHLQPLRGPRSGGRRRAP